MPGRGKPCPFRGRRRHLVRQRQSGAVPTRTSCRRRDSRRRRTLTVGRQSGRRHTPRPGRDRLRGGPGQRGGEWVGPHRRGRASPAGRGRLAPDAVRRSPNPARIGRPSSANPRPAPAERGRGRCAAPLRTSRGSPAETPLGRGGAAERLSGRTVVQPRTSDARTGWHRASRPMASGPGLAPALDRTASPDGPGS